MDRVIIDGKKYVIVKNYRDALNIADLEGKITDYFANFDYILGDYICKKIESKLVDTQEEMERILEDYARWKSKFPKSIENSKDLKENQKQKLKKKIEELQSEYERLH